MARAIEVEGLSKKYVIAHQRAGRYVALRDVIANKAKAALSFALGGAGSAPETEEFWAVKDVSFTVEQGDRIGIIGRNGAGKSTLLKLLSRITEPTAGKIGIRGRVSSLLEVGTGFHPELTGRENIFLNAAILGMNRHDIKKRFDEIVAFAEVERFLDTPVKRYSSGMYVRLAFSVAAHLEPEILIIDEVLAVGDAQFQKKCLGKMEDVGKAGRTVLFVSHNMAAVKALCSKALLLKSGACGALESPDAAIKKYLESGAATESAEFPIVRDELTVHGFALSQNGVPSKDFDGDYPIDVDIEFELSKPVKDFRIGFLVRNAYGENVLLSLLADWNDAYVNMDAGKFSIRGRIPAPRIARGAYAVALHASRFGVRDYGLTDAVFSNVTITNPGRFRRSYPGENHPFGPVILDSDWELKRL